MRIASQLALVGLLAAGLAGGWAWLGTEDEQTARADFGGGSAGAGVLVLAEPLALAEDRNIVRAVGTVDAQRSAAIHPSAPGEVVAIEFEAGQRVRKGDVLLRLDDDHQRLAVRLAEVALREAEREVRRLEELSTSGSVPKAGLETAQAALQTASLRLAQASADLADRVVKAPFDGVIGLTEVDVGDRVSTATLIATLDDRAALLVDFNLPENYAEQIRIGDSVTVGTPTGARRSIQGVVATTASRIDPASRTLRVRARIDNADDVIRPGSSVEVEMVFTGQSYPRVREVAVLWSRDGAYLWRVNEGRAEKVFVEVVRRDRGYVLVDGELDTEDLVVVEGVQGLRPGQRLETVMSGAPEAAPQGSSTTDQGERS